MPSSKAIREVQQQQGSAVAGARARSAAERGATPTAAGDAGEDGYADVGGQGDEVMEEEEVGAI